MTKATLGHWAGKRFWQCTEHVYSGARHDFRGHQCRNKAKHDNDADGNPTKCRLHSAEGKARLTQKREARIEAQMSEIRARSNSRKMAAECEKIVRAIADGHNDPRGLCSDWVARKDQTKGETP